MMTTTKIIENILSTYTERSLSIDLITAKSVKNITIDKKKTAIELELGFPVKRYQHTLITEITDLIRSNTDCEAVEVNIHWKVLSHSVLAGISPHPEVKNMIAIASAKGGVGKSTTAINLALALVEEGAQVGILDADIYGPNQPQMLGIKKQPDVVDKQLIPIKQYGLESMSIGYLAHANTPMVWRGPMASKALQQLVSDTAWKKLDYLIIDLPPGTGDIQLTLAQKIPVSGAVLVTTPQEVALLDVRKGMAMFEKVNVPILGIIENMSHYMCNHCGHVDNIFGEGGAKRLAKEENIELLGSLPINSQLCHDADLGKPTVIADPDCALSQTYRQIARRITAKLSLQPRDYSGKFPKIVVENK